MNKIKISILNKKQHLLTKNMINKTETDSLRFDDNISYCR